MMIVSIKRDRVAGVEWLRRTGSLRLAIDFLPLYGDETLRKKVEAVTR